MIYLLTGENSFEVEQVLAKMVADFNGDVDKYDGAELTLTKLVDALTSVSLFSTARLVIIRGLSENNAVWQALDQVVERLSDDVDLVLVEAKPDKRTVTYKKLVKIAKVQELTPWGDYDTSTAEKWVATEAKAKGVKMDKKSVQALVARVGMDQWTLSHALEKLACVDCVNTDVINDIIEANPNENVFNILEMALDGDKKRLQTALYNLQATEDPYRLVALMSSQVFQIAAVSAAGTDDNVAKDFGIHPYAVSRQKALAKKLGKNGVSRLVQDFANLDEQLKTSSAEPWSLVGACLISVG